ncbi:hypothetical protein AHIS1_p050 [Acaryochloris phage A-HIS1]|nr:hypothetical protein AHIS1_p050 [Acaryochloris phage A-HIS1]
MILTQQENAIQRANDRLSEIAFEITSLGSYTAKQLDLLAESFNVTIRKSWKKAQKIEAISASLQRRVSPIEYGIKRVSAKIRPVHSFASMTYDNGFRRYPKGFGS